MPFLCREVWFIPKLSYQRIISLAIYCWHFGSSRFPSEPKEVYSIVQKRHKTKPKSVNGDYCKKTAFFLKLHKSIIRTRNQEKQSERARDNFDVNYILSFYNVLTVSLTLVTQLSSSLSVFP